jgi:hypothetical protein
MTAETIIMGIGFIGIVAVGVLLILAAGAS